MKAILTSCLLLFLVIIGVTVYLSPWGPSVPETLQDGLEPVVPRDGDTEQEPVEEVPEEKPNPSKDDLIFLETPKEGDTITSPLIIKGEARGNWYFEANFPIVLTDWDGKIIAEGYATALDEWMTEEYVPFEAEIEFEMPEEGVSNRGALILQRANPSDLREQDNALEITIFYDME